MLKSRPVAWIPAIVLITASSMTVQAQVPEQVQDPSQVQAPNRVQALNQDRAAPALPAEDQADRRAGVPAPPSTGVEKGTHGEPGPDAPDTPPSLAPIVVNVERNPDKAGKSVWQGEELRTVPGALGDPLRALQSLPGVAVANDASVAPAIRGTRPADNAYYVDGLPVAYLFHAGDAVSVLHPSLVKDFELYSSGFGAQYGDVTGGVLDVGLRRPRTDRFGGTLDASLLGANVLLEGPVTQGQSFYVGANRSFLDLLIKNAKDTTSGVTVEIPSYSDYQAKYLWALNDANTLSFIATGAKDHIALSVPSSSTVAQQDPILSGDLAQDTSFGTQALVWAADVGQGYDNTLALGHTRTLDTTVLAAAGRVSTDDNARFVREQLRARVAQDHDVLAGADYRHADLGIDLDLSNPLCTEFDPQCDFTSAAKAQLHRMLAVNTWDSYLKDRWHIAGPLTLVLGVRHNADEYLNRAYTEPRLGAEWLLPDDLLLTAAWGRYNQQPDAQQIAPAVGNTGLDHLRATHSVLGVTGKVDHGWSWKVEGYVKSLTNLVTSDPLQNYVNGGSGTARGLEVLIRKDNSGRWSGWLAVSLARSRLHDDATGQSFSFQYDQPVIVNLVTNYQVSEHVLFGFKWAYHSGNLDTPIIGTGTYPDGRLRPLYGPTDSERLPAYHRLDLRLEQTVSPTYKRYLSILNAYNRHNISGYQYSANYSSRAAVNQLPLIISAGIEQKF